MIASQETVDFLVGYYAEMEAGDPDRYGKYLADNISLTFSNNQPINGRESVMEAYDGLLSSIEKVQHVLSNVWEEDNGTVIFETKSIYHMPDGSQKETVAAAVFKIANDQIVEQRIYVDMAPLTSES